MRTKLFVVATMVLAVFFSGAAQAKSDVSMRDITKLIEMAENMRQRERLMNIAEDQIDQFKNQPVQGPATQQAMYGVGPQQYQSVVLMKKNQELAAENAQLREALRLSLENESRLTQRVGELEKENGELSNRVSGLETQLKELIKRLPPPATS